jgi:HEAT repeat protein
MWPFQRRPDVERLAARRDVDGLARALTHDSAEVRRAAAVALGACCEPGAAAVALLPALQDEDHAVQSAAATSLAGLTPGPAVTALVARLAARAPEAPLVLAALGRLAADDLARATLEATLTAPEPRLRAAAATALGRRGDARSVPPLLAALGDADATVAAAAGEALAVVGPERSLAMLGAMLAAGPPVVRVRTAGVLGALSDARALTPLAHALADPEWSVRRAAIAAIRSLPEPGRQIAVLADLRLDPVERERGAQRLRQIGLLEPLAAALRAVDYPGLRAAAARAVARLGQPGVVEALAGAIDDPEPAVRQEATWMLGITRRPEALAPLTAALATADPGVRAAAARALGRLGEPAALSALTAARADPDEGVRAAAGRAIEALNRAAEVDDQPAGQVEQVVVFLVDPEAGQEPPDVTHLLDQAAPDALEAKSDIQIVTMAPGQSLPSDEQAALIVRKQFRTAPPGYAWRPSRLVDEAGRAFLVMQLRAHTE